ncbi:MAG TPA: amino acid ABC transporter permease [Rhodobacteraceae bacterium]|nr:amino acid ABC transporter permease [Paracoccaceae bacterium]
MPLHPRQDNDFPYWLLVTATIGLYLAYRVATDELYTQVITIVSKGVWVTVFVTIVTFLIASAFGLLLAVGSLSRFMLFRQLARFYIEIVRGIPILVLLFYIAFVAAPGLVVAINWVIEPLGFDPMRTRDLSMMWKSILALTIGYSAFIAEVFRAGIQSVDIGQIEAAKALGLNGWQRFRQIIFPQAVRTIMPPLGNDFIALIKDSSLVSVLGVADITQLGKIYAAGSFRFFETYNIVAYVYLLMTVTLSLGLRRLERKMRAEPLG